jgi:hypothetical protein
MIMYDERYVAFADILGFANIVRQTEYDVGNKRYNALVQILTEIGSYNEPTINESDYFQFQSFSDSVIMSTASTTTGLLHLLHSMSNLSIRLLSTGLLIRGAIAKGKLHHDQYVMFGPAFLAAYNVEAHIAKYPRVVLSREVYQDFRRLTPSLKFPQVLLADDGPPYLHVLARFEPLNEGHPTPDYLNSEEVRLAQTCQRSIQNLLDDSIYEPSHYEKLRWLAIYWNATVATKGTGAPLEMIMLPASRNV